MEHLSVAFRNLSERIDVLGVRFEQLLDMHNDLKADVKSISNDITKRVVQLEDGKALWKSCHDQVVDLIDGLQARVNALEDSSVELSKKPSNQPTRCDSASFGNAGQTFGGFGNSRDMNKALDRQDAVHRVGPWTVEYLDAQAIRLTRIEQKLDMLLNRPVREHMEVKMSNRLMDLSSVCSQLTLFRNIDDDGVISFRLRCGGVDETQAFTSTDIRVHKDSGSNGEFKAIFDAISSAWKFAKDNGLLSASPKEA